MSSLYVYGLGAALVMVLIVSQTDVVCGKSILRRIMENRELRNPPVGRGMPVMRGGFGGGRALLAAIEEELNVPMERCRIKYDNEDLAIKMLNLCRDCGTAFGARNNIDVKCRTKCFDNSIVERCAGTMMRPDLFDEFAKYKDNVTSSGQKLTVEEPAIDFDEDPEELVETYMENAGAVDRNIRRVRAPSFNSRRALL